MNTTPCPRCGGRDTAPLTGMPATAGHAGAISDSVTRSR